MHSQKSEQSGKKIRLQFWVLNKCNQHFKKNKNHPTSLTHRTTSTPMFASLFVISLHLELTYLRNPPFGLEASPFQMPGPRDNKRLQDNFETSIQRHKPTKPTLKAAMPTNENDLPTMFQIRRRTFRGIESSSSPPVLGIVVHKHIV